jgi:hypothetical protein
MVAGNALRAGIDGHRFCLSVSDVAPKNCRSPATGLWVSEYVERARLLLQETDFRLVVNREVVNLVGGQARCRNLHELQQFLHPARGKTQAGLIRCEGVTAAELS